MLTYPAGFTLNRFHQLSEISILYRLLNGQRTDTVDSDGTFNDNSVMGLMDRAFGADKHTLANHRLSIHWDAAKIRFTEHKSLCKDKGDVARCDKLIAICDDVQAELVSAKKGFGVFDYDINGINSYMDQVAELVGDLDIKLTEPEKIANLFVETSNILSRRYR